MPGGAFRPRGRLEGSGHTRTPPPTKLWKEEGSRAGILAKALPPAGGRGRLLRFAARAPLRALAASGRGMQAEPRPEEEEEEEEEEGGEEGGGEPESAFGKSPFQLTAEDVYDISYVLGRELHKLSSGPRGEVPARVAQLQFKVVAVLEMLEALVAENNLALEALRMERDSLKREAEELRKEAASGSPAEVNLGPGKMVIDLADANRPRFTLQELREVLQERNQLKAQLLVVQEELQCYKSGLISQKQDWVEPTQKELAVGTTSGSSKGREEKTTIRRLFNFKRL